jgi:hypothetical protein
MRVNLSCPPQGQIPNGLWSVSFAKTTRDLTNRRNVEVALRRSERQLADAGRILARRRPCMRSGRPNQGCETRVETLFGLIQICARKV